MYEMPILQISESIPLANSNSTSVETVVEVSSSVVSVPIEATSIPSSVETATETTSNTTPQTTETISTPPDYDCWINKPVNDYTATEGLLLILVVYALGALVANLFEL